MPISVVRKRRVWCVLKAGRVVITVGSSGNLGPRLERGTAGLRGEPAGGRMRKSRPQWPECRECGGQRRATVTWGCSAHVSEDMDLTLREYLETWEWRNLDLTSMCSNYRPGQCIPII